MSTFPNMEILNSGDLQSQTLEVVRRNRIAPAFGFMYRNGYSSLNDFSASELLFPHIVSIIFGKKEAASGESYDEETLGDDESVNHSQKRLVAAPQGSSWGNGRRTKKVISLPSMVSIQIWP